jgi:fascin 1/2
MSLPVQPGDALPWALGFRNAAGMYLTVESFGDAMNFNGKSMKKKQIFQLEQDEGAGEKVYIKTPHGRYLTAKDDGTWAANGEDKGPNELFTIEAQADGRWALKSAHGYYCGGAGEKFDAFTKVIQDDRLFVVNLAMHPQICMWNVNRKTFLHLEKDTINCDEEIPWGADATITLHFFQSGKYGLRACNGKFLCANGSLTDDETEPSAQFTLKFFGGQVAFVSSTGKLLTCIGGNGQAKATKPEPPTKDELFVMEDSHPQIKMTSHKTKRVSIRQGIEVSANQDTTEDTECFQIEIDGNGLWNFRSNNNKFWYVKDDGAIMADGATKTTPESKFQIEWVKNSLAIKASNGKYVSTIRTGQLYAKDSSITPEGTFVYELINRPLLVLRGHYGFINNTSKTQQLMCSSASPRVYKMEVIKGECIISDDSGYWTVADDGSSVSVTGAAPQKFYLEFVSLSKFAIKYFNAAGDGFYLKSNQNGALTADGTSINDMTVFEY